MLENLLTMLKTGRCSSLGEGMRSDVFSRHTSMNMCMSVLDKHTLLEESTLAASTGSKKSVHWWE